MKINIYFYLTKNTFKDNTAVLKWICLNLDKQTKLSNEWFTSDFIFKKKDLGILVMER